MSDEDACAYRVNAILFAMEERPGISLSDTETAIFVRDTRRLLTTIETLTAERDAAHALVELLLKHLSHDGLCARIGGYGYCNCGMEIAQEQARALVRDGGGDA